MQTLASDTASLLDAARALEPLIQASRDEMERQRQLPRSLALAMADAGLFRLYLPRALGGFEVDPITFVRVVEEVARVDGAAGWNLMIGASYSALAAYLREDVAREIYCRDPHTILAGTINPTGRALAVQGGYRVSGRWSFGSGIQQANWVIGNCVVHEGEAPRLNPDGSSELRIVIFPADQCQIHDTWHVGGLRATGSHDYSVADLFVPAERTVIAFVAPPHQPGTLYRCPFITIFAAGIAAPALGMARGAIDALVELASTKVPTGARVALRERPAVQVNVARAEALLGSAREFLFASLRDLWAALEASGESTLKPRALVRIAIAHAASSAAQAVDLMYNAGGGTSLYESSRLERYFRDVHAATQHVGVAPGNFELGGRVLLGLDPGTDRF